MLSCEYFLDSASGRGMTERVTPHTMRGPEEDKRDFHLRGLPVFTS